MSAETLGCLLCSFDIAYANPECISAVVVEKTECFFVYHLA